MFFVQIINEMFQNVMSEDKVLEMVSKAQEFEQIKVTTDTWFGNVSM